MEDFRPDTDLIAASLDGPREFGPIFERHWDAVFRFFERRLGPAPSADLAAEVFRIAFERRSGYRPERSGSCLPWLYGIAANLALKERRRFARQQAARDRAQLQEIDSGGDHAVEVAAGVDRERVWPRVRDALAEMDSTSREMLLLVAWEGLSYREVAEALGMPVGTVRSRLHRARSRLRSRLEADPALSNETSREGMGP